MATSTDLFTFRGVFQRIRNLLPKDLRSYLLPVVYGLGGGLSAVAFQLSIQYLYLAVWPAAARLGLPGFALVSLLTILTSTLVAGVILTRVSREAAGSGIPQIKAAFWRDFGFVRARAIGAKFVAGVITIGGGSSLGREGPSVHIAAAVASNLAGRFGVAKQGRRPALLSGAAAGLAAAFNTPLSAITFVLEEIMEDLNSTRFFAQVLIAAVTATFVAHVFLGNVPAFDIPNIRQLHWPTFFLVIPVAALAAVAGCAFQRATLSWRSLIKKGSRVPEAFRPALGGLVNWALGVLVFAGTGRLGVFSLGYDDLNAMLRGQVPLGATLLLSGAKLAATIAVYAWGGCGGIFSPTLFFGAGAGLLVSEAAGLALPLTPSDRIALTVAGMSACLGAVVRAPITSIVIVFEMTHEFSFVPVLMIGTLVSQAVSRALCKTNFYSEVLERDGVELEHHIPPRSFTAVLNRPVASIANFAPVTLQSLDAEAARQAFAGVAYRQLPVLIDDRIVGVVDRQATESTGNGKIPCRPPLCIDPKTSIREAIDLMVSQNTEMLLLTSGVDRHLVGIITLHDVLRFENQLAELE
ncbi:MAG TPA: chloride channel protein [Chthoniobacterales bacterium]